MQHSTRTVSFTLGAAAAALFFSAFAHAKDVTQVGSDPAKIEISYADLDLADASSATALYARIENAAYNVCHRETGPNARALMLERRCIAKAVSDAVVDVGNTNLTAVYQAKTGKRAVVASSR
jgi:UrcA family protein